MNLFRVLLLLGAVWLIWKLYKSFKPQIRHEDAPPAPPTPGYEPMARCVACGVHAPAGTLSSSGRCGRCSE